MRLKPDALSQSPGQGNLGGKPLTSGTIIFTPSEKGQQAQGVIGSDGTFVLGTLKENDGACPGKYRVSFFVSNQSSFEAPPSAKPRETPIPAKYYAPATSGLSFVVEEGKINEADFDLKSH